MGLMSYKRVGSGRGSSSSSCPRGFKLNPRRLYVVKLRKRFTFFLTLFHQWKLSYSQALRLLKKVFHRRSGFRRNYSNSSSNTSSLGKEDFRVKSYGRSTSSFYAEAIEDCLEFIKRTSISMDQVQDPDTHIQD